MERSIKKPHDISKMFKLIRKAISPYPKAMLFEIYDQGFRLPFEQLIACLLSIRTRDETSLVVVKKLFSVARTPQEFVELGLEELTDLIRPCTFPIQKAKTILNISSQVVSDFKGRLPCDFDTLTSFSGVGPKCANLVLGISCGQASIGVDIHVHRITNRWGFVSTPTPEKTMLALEKKLDKSKWVEINELLVPFGKHICTGSSPKCPSCPVLQYCQQIGVNRAAQQIPKKAHFSFASK